MIIEYILIGIGISVLYVYLFFVWRFNFWKRKGVYTITPKIPYGNFENFVKGKRNLEEELTDAYQILKRKGLKFGGLFLCTRPTLILADVDLINTILVKDFSHFTDRAVYRNENVDLLTKSFFHNQGEKWATIRAKITALFSPNRIKSMFNIIVVYSDRMCSLLDDCFKDGEPVNIKKIDFRLSLDVNNYLTFGVDADSLQNPNSPYYLYNENSFRHGRWDGLKRLLSVLFPHFFRFLRIKVFDKGIESFYKKLVEEKDITQINSISFVDNLLKLTIETNNDFSLSHDLIIEEITAHGLVLLQGGFDGTANVLTFLFYEIAVHPEIQEKIRNEIYAVLTKFDNEITYESVLEMEYLDKCFQESTRKNAPASAITRECTKPYKIPGTDVVLSKGDTIIVSMLGIHRDPDYYPDPDKYDPERFSKENKSNIKSGAFFPFSMGPRVCVGRRLATMIVKIAVLTILRKYRITLNSKTKLPLEFDPTVFGLGAKNDVWLNLEKVQ